MFGVPVIETDRAHKPSVETATNELGQEVPHISPHGYVPWVGLRRSP